MGTAMPPSARLSLGRISATGVKDQVELQTSVAGLLMASRPCWVAI